MTQLLGLCLPGNEPYAEISLFLLVLSRFSHVRLSANQAPLPMGFSKQEYRNRLPFPSQGIFSTQGSNPRLLRLLYWWVSKFTTSATWEAC